MKKLLVPENKRGVAQNLGVAAKWLLLDFTGENDLPAN
jgi:hypothetical protein